MQQIKITNPGPEGRFTLCEGPKPIPSATQILVRNTHCAINKADLLQCAGKYPPPLGESDIPGLELAGEVVALGSHVTQFKRGDKVYALVGSGAFAQYCCVEESLAAKLPPAWSTKLAAALPEALMTVHATVFELGALKSHQSVLIHGAGSGITSLAIQMAHQIQAQIKTTVGKNEKRDKAKALGADTVLNYNTCDFEKNIPESSVDLVLDFIGGDYFQKHLRLLKPKGKLVQIACIKGNKVELPLALLMQKRLSLLGFILRSQSLEEKALLWKSAHERWLPLLTQGKITPIIDSIHPFHDIEAAVKHMRESAHFGKIILEIP